MPSASWLLNLDFAGSVAVTTAVVSTRYNLVGTDNDSLDLEGTDNSSFALIGTDTASKELTGE